MSEKFTAYAHVDESGRIAWKQLARLRKALITLFKDKDVQIDFQVMPGERTNQQLRYFFGVVARDLLIAFRANGNTHMDADDVYQEVLKRFAPGEPIVDGRTGEIIGETKRSFSRMSREEISTVIEKAVDWGLDFWGIQIPPPMEV